MRCFLMEMWPHLKIAVRIRVVIGGVRLFGSTKRLGHHKVTICGYDTIRLLITGGKGHDFQHDFHTSYLWAKDLTAMVVRRTEADADPGLG